MTSTGTSEPVARAGGAVLLTLCAGQFLMALDSSVMNVSIATVAKDLTTTSVLIAALSASFLTGIAQDPDVPKEVASQATVQLEAGVPFVSDAQLQSALEGAGVDAKTTAAIVDVNEQARVKGLRSALALLAIIGTIGLFFTRQIPTRQPGRVQAAVGTEA